MPWFNSTTGEHVYSPSDYNGLDELKYKASAYVKEELPTWSEVYEDFYLNKIFTYDGESDMDLYWKIPHNKFLIAVVCNQFNKMLYEDNLKAEILEELNKVFKLTSDPIVVPNPISIINNQLMYTATISYGKKELKITDEITDICFNCGDENTRMRFVADFQQQGASIFNQLPKIYTIDLPNGKPNPFIRSYENRINVNDIGDNISLWPHVLHNNGKGLTSLSPSSDEFNIIINVMIKRFKEYFDGIIGWKDQNGKLIGETCESCKTCNGAGSNN